MEKMQEKVQKRIDLALQLLNDLKETCLDIKQVLLVIKSNSAEFYVKFFEECKPEIKGDIDEYKANIRMMKQTNQDLTSSINGWYEFVKDQGQMRRFAFPFRFHLRKKNLYKTIKKTNNSISGLIVQNRFIMERISDWERQLRLRAVDKIKQHADYAHYQELVNKKESIISELVYLLRTIPDICPIDVDIGSLDSLEQKLSDMFPA